MSETSDPSPMEHILSRMNTNKESLIIPQERFHKEIMCGKIEVVSPFLDFQTLTPMC